MTTRQRHHDGAAWRHPAHFTRTQSPARGGPRGLSQTCGCQVGWQGGGKDWESGVSRGKSLYTGCIHTQVLLEWHGALYVVSSDKP